MKDLLFKYRFFLASCTVLIGYILISHDQLQRRLAGDHVIFLIGLASVVVISSIFVARHAFKLRLLWAVLIPEIGSIIGYGLTVISFIYTHDKMSVGLEFVPLIAFVFPLILLRIWAISLALLIFCITDYFCKKSKIPKY